VPRPSLLHAALAIIPPVVLVAFIAAWAVDVPIDDQWELVPLLEKSSAGTLSAGDLWAQHNEHRLVLPRATMLVLAKLTSWDTRYELAVSFALAAATFLALVSLARRTAESPWLPALVSVVLFSLRQFENWLWGWQIQIFMAILAVVLAFALLARPAGRIRFGAALALGAAATFSFASGALVWPLGLLVIASAETGGARRARALAWSAVGLALVAAYAWGFEPPSRHPLLGAALRRPLELVTYFLVYLGAPVSPVEEWHPEALAAGAGVLGCAAFLAAVRLLARGHPERRDRLAFWLALALFAVGNAALCGLARSTLPQGALQAFASRYVTISSLLWIALVVLLVAVAAEPRPAAASRGERAFRAACVPSVLAIASLVLVGWYRSFGVPSGRAAYLRPARSALVTGSEDALLGRLHENVALTKQRAAVLRRLGLSVYRR
jgi:hypothetical protein